MGQDADSDVGDQRTDAFESSRQRSTAVGIRVTEACPNNGVTISEAVIHRRRSRHHLHHQQQHQIYYIWSAFAVLLGHWNLPPPPPL